MKLVEVTQTRSQAMNVIEAMRLRKSIRRFKPEPVSMEILTEILEVAARAPSGKNAQPWEITVVTGKTLDKLKRSNVEMLLSGAVLNPHIEYKDLEGVYRRRQVDLAVQLFQLMGIAREDREKRAEWNQRGFRFFDAPVAIILSTDSSLDEARTQFDIGIITQSICLAALHYDLGTCIVRQGVYYPEVVRKFTGIPASKRIIIGIAIGYPDWAFPANKLESERELVKNITTWCD